MPETGDSQPNKRNEPSVADDPTIREWWRIAELASRPQDEIVSEAVDSILRLRRDGKISEDDAAMLLRQVLGSAASQHFDELVRESLLRLRARPRRASYLRRLLLSR